MSIQVGADYWKGRFIIRTPTSGFILIYSFRQDELSKEEEAN